MPEKVEFPYSSIGEATKDKYRRIGGPDQAFRYMVKGFKSIEWRRRADKNAREMEAAQDEAFRKENAK